MEICSIDILAAADRLNLLCCGAGREKMAAMLAGLATMLRRSNEMSQFVLSTSKGRCK